MAYSKTKYFTIKLVNSHDVWLTKIWKIFRSYRNHPWNFRKSMYAMKLKQKKIKIKIELLPNHNAS